MKVKITVYNLFYFLVSLPVLVIAIMRISFPPIVYSYILVITFFFLFIISIKKKNFSIYQIYLVTFFLFLVSRSFLFCIGLVDLHELDLYESNSMDDKLLRETLCTIIVFLLGTSYGWMLTDDAADKRYFYKTADEYSLVEGILEKLFAVYAILFALKVVYQIYISINFGYTAFFNGTIDNIQLPIIFTGVGIITELLLMLLIYYNRKERSFKKYIFIFTFLCLVRLLSGKRGYTLSFILFFLYMWSTYYHEIKIHNKKIIALVLIVPVLIEMVANFRYDKAIDLLEMVKNNIYFKVLDSQGVTITIVANTIKYQKEFTNEYPFFIGYIIDFFQKEPPGQVIQDITMGNYLGDHLTYTLNSTMFFAGRGTGTSIVAEAYDLMNGNLFLVMLFATVTTYIILKIGQKAYKSVVWFAISYYLLIDFILSPRGSILSSISSIVIAIAFTVAIRFFERKRKSVEIRKSQDYIENH